MICSVEWLLIADWAKQTAVLSAFKLPFQTSIALPNLSQPE
jgi:hypothetical protein